jgi:4-hydroxy-3-methylbut-2-en-1-yl diphosphate reductase
MQVTIDPHSGFCFGVVYAIEVAERELKSTDKLYCLGDIVHNNMEVNRLKEMGLIIIDPEDLHSLHDCRVLIRAHGEPPATYQVAIRNNIELIDASCPIVLHLQNDIRYGWEEMKKKNGQIVIYGKEGHAEVNGLKGQTEGNAIIIGSESDLEKIDFSRPVRFYAQTTMGIDGFQRMVQLIGQRMQEAGPGREADFIWNDSVCRQVSNRSAQLRGFAAMYDVIIFVSGLKSSNGMILYKVCREINPDSHMISSKQELQKDWFTGKETVGVCGATSTPMWLMEDVAGEIKRFSS